MNQGSKWTAIIIVMFLYIALICYNIKNNSLEEVIKVKGEEINAKDKLIEEQEKTIRMLCEHLGITMETKNDCSKKP